METLEETLSVEGQDRWALLENLASENGYELQGRDSYRRDGEHLVRIGRTVIFLRDMTDEKYREVRKLLEQRAGTTTSPSVTVTRTSLEV